MRFIERHEKLRRFCYVSLQIFTKSLFKIFFRVKVTGLENIPERGGVILAANHASYLDPEVVGAIIKREMSFFPKKELFSVPVVNQVLFLTKSIPVDRAGFSRSSLKDMIRRLNEGRAVLIFPEGTRTKTGELREPKRGVGMVAVHAGVPIVPCYIEGSFRAKPFFSKISVHFLPPFLPSEIQPTDGKDNYLLVSERIMCDISRLYNLRKASVAKA